MKITAIRTLPFRADWRNWLFVKAETDEGISGVGEAGLLGHEWAVDAAVHNLEAYFIGKDPRQIELHWNTIYRNGYYRPSFVLLSAIGGVEMALWDILGKSLNVPVYALLGGACHPRIKVYNNAWYLPARSLEDYGKLAQEEVSKGFKFLKWDPFWGCDAFIDREQMRRAIECVRIVREAVGDEAELLIEVHGRLSPEDAIRVARELEEYRPFWIEEPIPPDCSVDALAKVASSTSIPIAAGERVCTRWGFREIFEKQAVAIIQPDIIQCGGILETKKIAAMAQVYYMRVAPHSACGPILAAASVHLDASIPNFMIQEFFYPDMPFYEEILKEPFPVPKDGFIELPTKPGLGVELNEDALKKHPFQYRPEVGLGGLWGRFESFGE